MLLINAAFIDSWSKIYDKKNIGTSDQIVENAILSWSSKHKYLNKKYFICLSHWKTPRYARTRKTNNEKTIIKATKSAYSQADDLKKLTILKNNLKGVGTAVASTILYFLQPNDYPIFDYHVRNTLIKAGKLKQSKDNYSNSLWLKYVTTIRGLAKLHRRSIRETEKALFAYDKWPEENPNGIKSQTSNIINGDRLNIKKEIVMKEEDMQGKPFQGIGRIDQPNDNYEINIGLALNKNYILSNYTVNSGPGAPCKLIIKGKSYNARLHIYSKFHQSYIGKSGLKKLLNDNGYYRGSVDLIFNGYSIELAKLQKR